MAVPAHTADEAKFQQHPEPWTLREVLALPEDQGNRVELIDGTVIVSPAPTYKHQWVQQEIQVALRAARPPELDSVPGVNIVLNGARLLIPDVAVVTRPRADTVYFKGTELLMAVEIHSPSTRAYDRALKRQAYAEAGVPFLLLVDPATDPVSGVCYELNGDEYRESACSDAGVLTLTRPFAVTVDLTGQGH
jgi:Uma2 family endonuclease